MKIDLKLPMIVVVECTGDDEAYEYLLSYLTNKKIRSVEIWHEMLTDKACKKVNSVDFHRMESLCVCYVGKRPAKKTLSKLVIDFIDKNMGNYQGKRGM